MACTLQLRVQTDRLPDLTDGTIQLGVRVSARFTARQQWNPTPIDEAAEILYPWKWESWDHDPQNWDVFVWNDAGWRRVDPISCPLPRDLRQDLCTVIENYITSSDNKSLEVPKDQHNVEDAAVAPKFNIPVFLETLPTLPAPFPEGLGGWTCLQFAWPVDDDGVRLVNPVFVAFPKRHFDAVDCTVIDRTALADGAVEQTLTFLTPPAAAPVGPPAADGAAPPPPPASAREPIDAVEYRAQPSLPDSVAVGDPSQGRLLDLKNLAVGGDDTSVEISDWLHDLAPAVGRLLDPGVQALAVLDGVVADAAMRAPDAGRTPVRKILADDVKEGGRDILRQVVTYLSYPVIAPRPAEPVFGAPPSYAALQQLISPGDPDGIVTFLRAIWNAQPIPPMPPAAGGQNLLSLLSPYRPFGRDRLASLVSDEPTPTTVPEARLDDDDAYARLLVDYWLVEAASPAQPWVTRVRDAFLGTAASFGPSLRSAMSVAFATDALTKIFADPASWPRPVDTPPDLSKHVKKVVTNEAAAIFTAAFDQAFRLAVRTLDLRSLPGLGGVTAGLPADMSLNTLYDALRELPETTPELHETFTALAGLLITLRDKAIDHAGKGGERLVPRPGEGTIAERLRTDGLTSQTAPPCLFHFDQLQQFAQGEDLWERLSGLGVLVGRDDLSEDTSWWSLNVAALLKARDQQPIPIHDQAAPWQIHARLDPVPLVVSEINGVRDVALQYNSQSIVAMMDSAPTAGTPPRATTPFRYVFPVLQSHTDETWFPRLPPLTFGRTFLFAPYLIGHGGALPSFLRAIDANPTQRRDYTDRLGSIAPARQPPSVRKLDYLRTRPVSAPTLDREQVLPGVPPGVAPLGAELPASRPVVSLGQNGTSRWFLDGNGRGMLPPPADVANEPVLEIDLGNVTLPAGATLKVEIFSTTPDDAWVESSIAEAALSGAFAGQLRLHLGTNGVAAQKGLPRALAEDEPVYALVEALGKNLQVTHWGDAHIRISTDDLAGNDFVHLSPPSVRWGIGLGAQFVPVHDQPQRAPEDHGETPPIHILDGFRKRSGKAPREAVLALRFPTVDLATFDRWVNGPISRFVEDPVANLSAIKQNVSRAISRAHDRAVADSTEVALLDDPAVDQLVVELVEVFPGGSSGIAPIIGFLGARRAADDLSDLLGLAPADGGYAEGSPALNLLVAVSDTPRTAWEDHNQGLDLAPGKTYDIRIYPVVAAQQPLASTHVNDRFATCVRSTWRAWNGRWLGTPCTVRFEVATDEVPLIPADCAVGKRPLLQFEALRAPATPTDRILVSLNPDFAPQDTRFYQAMRYVDQVTLIDQQWSWRGFPQPPDASTADGNMLDDLGWAWIGDAPRDRLLTYAHASFQNRADDDADGSAPIKLTRAHVYAGRSTIGGPADARSPILFDKILRYRGGANLWRFGLSLRSRYAAMAQTSRALEVDSRHDAATPTINRWQTLVVPDLGHGPAPARPALAMVMPVTRTVDRADRVAPVLALFNESFFAGANIADDVEAVVETVRHPMPDDGEQKFWPEFGPDPIRTGRRWSGDAVALRIDGPLGYTFDAGTPLGRFDHSGAIISAVGTVDPWSFVKIRFRRTGIVEFLQIHESPPWSSLESQSTVASRLINAPDIVSRVDNPAEPQRFAIQHEGVVFETALTMNDRQTVRAGFLRDTVVDNACLNAGIDISFDASGLVISSAIGIAPGAVGLGPRFSLHVSPESTVTIRLVASQRAKPNGGVRYVPTGDLVVRVFVATPDGSSADEADDRWMSVLALPLAPTAAFARPLPGNSAGSDTTVASNDEVFVGFSWSDTTTKKQRIAPLRLSDFTPGTWCQFPGLSDQIGTAGQAPLLASDCRAAQYRLGNSTLSLTLGDANAVVGPPAMTAETSVVERMIAIVTANIRDASAKLRERPIAVHLLKEAPTQDRNQGQDITLATSSIWLATDRPDQPTDGSVRFARVLVRRRPPTAGIDPAETDITRLFSAAPAEVDDAYWSPENAPGIILGISSAIPLSII